MLFVSEKLCSLSFELRIAMIEFADDLLEALKWAGRPFLGVIPRWIYWTSHSAITSSKKQHGSS